MNLPTLFTVILLLPLVSAAIITLFLRRRGALAEWVSVSTGFLIMGLSLYALLVVWDGQPFHQSWTWLTFGNFSYRMGYYFDNQAALMLLVVSFVASWIQLFSVGYMDEDEAQGRFFGGLSIFMFSML